MVICCALHNWLLDVDGLTEEWVGGICIISSNWDGEMGCLDFVGVQVEVPNALSRLSANLDPRNYNSLGLGPGLDVIGETRDLLTRELPEYEEATQSILISTGLLLFSVDYWSITSPYYSGTIKLCG
jgi:hypothetical protein